MQNFRETLNLDRQPQKVSSIRAQYIQQMFNQANCAIRNLLKQLDHIYLSYGIRYEIGQYYEMVLRILTPYELMTHYKIKDNSELFQESFYPFYSQFSTLPNLQSASKKFKNTANQQKIQRSEQSNKQLSEYEEKLSNKLQKQYEQTNKANMKETKPSFNKIGRKCIYKINNGGKPILEPAQEEQVCKFVQNCVRKGWVLTKPIIANKAKQVANNNPNFLGSVGWVKNFLKRHPYMKELYDQSRLDHYNSYVDHEGNATVNAKDKIMLREQFGKAHINVEQLQFDDKSELNEHKHIQTDENQMEYEEHENQYFKEPECQSGNSG